MVRRSCYQLIVFIILALPFSAGVSNLTPYLNLLLSTSENVPEPTPEVDPSSNQLLVERQNQARTKVRSIRQYSTLSFRYFLNLVRTPSPFYHPGDRQEIATFISQISLPILS
jgi:hypothetical protein